MLADRILALLLLSQARSAFISHTYIKVADENYSFPSVGCEFYSPVHWPVHAATCGQMCIMQDCLMFALNMSGCAVCQYTETPGPSMLDWQTFSAVLKKREFISIHKKWLVGDQFKTGCHDSTLHFDP